MKSLLLLALGCVAMLAAGCASGDDDDDGGLASVQCDAQTIPKYAEVLAFHKCVMCHSSTLSGNARRQANPSVNFDTYLAAKAQAEAAVHQVQAGQMPPSPSGITLTAGEKDQLSVWALCGAPN
jgi:uncharacterized membrane protein